MVQVDIFWSYGLASGLALAAGKKSKKSSLLDSREFLMAMLWISIFFAPSGMYLLWAFPGWETMFVASTHTDIPAWLVCLFGVTNITQAWLGYFITWKFLQNNQRTPAIWQPIWSHACMLFILVFGWDGSGITRFTYAGTGPQWHQGVSYPWTAFFSSSVFYTLLGMGVFLIPSYIYLIRNFRKS